MCKFDWNRQSSLGVNREKKTCNVIYKYEDKSYKYSKNEMCFINTCIDNNVMIMKHYR